MDTTPNTARTGLVRLTRIGTDLMTGQPLMWSGTGRPPSHASTASRDLDLYLGYAERDLAALLDAGDGALGAFASTDHLRDVARRFMRTSNAIFNRLRRHKAAVSRAAAKAQNTAPADTSSEKVETPR